MINPPQALQTGAFQVRGAYRPNEHVETLLKDEATKPENVEVVNALEGEGAHLVASVSPDCAGIYNLHVFKETASGERESLFEPLVYVPWAGDLGSFTQAKAQALFERVRRALKT